MQHGRETVSSSVLDDIYLERYGPSLPSQRPQLTQMMSPVFEAHHLGLDTLEGDITPAHHAGHRLTSKIEAGVRRFSTSRTPWFLPLSSRRKSRSSSLNPNSSSPSVLKLPTLDLRFVCDLVVIVFQSS